MRKKRVLIASPVHQRPSILRPFLDSLGELKRTNANVGYLFYDDNEDEASRDLLHAFRESRPGTIVLRSDRETSASYSRDEYTHYWKEELIWKVADMKDRMLRHALERGYDYIFLVDSDLVLHPLTLERLIETGKDIVSNIFWTRWQPNTIEMPQVWLRDEYTMTAKRRGETLTDEESAARTKHFLAMLRVPGLYEVGGLGACTLISRKAIRAGVRFAEIKNLSFWGEDRHFCIRAQALGFDLFVDTHYPAYHLYREADLAGVESFKRLAGMAAEAPPAITISVCLIVKNEEEALPNCLSGVRGIADEIVVVDTGSDDRTKEIAASFGAVVYDFEWVDDFAAARNFAFSKATQQYILWLDADDTIREKDRRLLAELKRTLDPSVDSVSMHYHLVLDENGNATHSLRRNRLVKREKGFRWIGAVHEYLEVGGNVLHSEIAITHNKNKTYTDRNLQIYRKRKERGEAFTARDMYYYANELRDHSFYEEAAVQYEEFLASGLGWIEDNVAACLKLADCYGHLCERESRLEALVRTFVYDVPRAESCCRLGAYFLDCGDPEKAAYWYELATRLTRSGKSMGPVDHAAWTWLPHLQLCVCLDRLGRHEEAKHHNDIALSMNPNHPSMLYNKQYFDRLFAAKG
ncbi:glycosyltransferase [Paenibacillus sp. GYB003]|uniref:glycosyltransferase n=1 Tax=Paenibacillus sp. GYB003 TaxID=2994392 RepID=UPI002F969A40